MTLAALPLPRSTPLGQAEAACASRCALFAQQIDDRETRLAVLAAGGKYARRALQLLSLGVRR